LATAGADESMLAFCDHCSDDVNCFAVGVELQCIGHFKLLFSLLRVDGRPIMQQHALEVNTL